MADKITLAKAKAAAQKQRIRILAMSGIDTPPQNVGVSMVPIESIFTDKALFQNREADFSEESVGRILRAVENGSFRMEVFDPVLLWKKPADGRLYILSGHSRTEAFRRLAKSDKRFKSIPAKTISVAENEAKKIARESNTLSTRESDLERGAYYRNLRKEGTEEKELIALSRQNEGKNGIHILNLSYLSPRGYAVGRLKSLDEAGEGQKTNMAIIADWTGQARRTFPPLTDEHENEISEYLFLGGYGTKPHQFSSRQKFMDRLRVVVLRATEFGQFRHDKPLNLKNAAATGTQEAQFNARYNALLKEVADAELTFKEKSLYAFTQLREGKTTQERADALVAQYGASWSAAKLKLNALVADRDKYLQSDKAQTQLFGLSGTNNGLLAQLAALPALAEKLRFAKANFKRKGEGSSRIVYTYGQYVIKLAKDRFGVASNRYEYGFYKENPHYPLAKVVARSRDFHLIVSQALKPVTPAMFKKAVGVRWQDFMQWHENSFMLAKGKFFMFPAIDPAIDGRLSQSEFAQKILRIAIKTDLARGDLARSTSYGLDKEGVLRLLDYGSTNAMIRSRKSGGYK